MTLRLADLPAGLTVTGEGYRRHSDVRSFLREFEVARNRVESAGVLYLRSMTQIAESEDAAAVTLRYSGTTKGSRHLARLVVRGALKTEARALAVQPLDVEGADTVAWVATFSTPKMRVAVVVLYVRAGVALGSLTAVGPAARLDPAEILALAPTVRDRLHSTP